MKTHVKALFFILLVSACSQTRLIKNNIQIYVKHDTVRDRYILDTITIRDPLLVIYNDSLFVIRESYLRSFLTNPTNRSEGEGQQVFYIIPGCLRIDAIDPNDIPYDGSELTFRIRNHIMDSYLLYDWRDYTDILSFRETINDIEIYTFEPKPSKFVLELVIEPINGCDNKYKYKLYQENGVIKYTNKLDSLETIPKTNREPRFVLTVEPLYSRETINKYIDDEGVLSGRPGQQVPHPKLCEKRVKLQGLPDL